MLSVCRSNLRSIALCVVKAVVHQAGSARSLASCARNQERRPFARSLLLGGAFALCALSTPSGAFAQSLNPSAETQVRFRVNDFIVEGFSSISDRRLDPKALSQELERIRSGFAETYSVDEIHQVADQLTLWVRKQGFVFHTVYLPPQTVDNGRVKLVLREGVLADVRVNNKTQWKDKRFTKPFKKLLGKTLYGPRVEQVVQALKSQSGFEVFPFYSRGAEPGEARLNLRVVEAQKRRFSLKADNYGSTSSGEYRSVLQYSEFQFTGHHDTLSLALMQALDGNDNTYGSFYYSLPSASLKYRWSFSASNNQFRLGERFESLGLEGELTSYRLGLTRYASQQPSNSESLSYGLFQKTNELNNPEALINQERSSGLSITWNKGLQFAQSRVAFNSSLSATGGEVEFGAETQSLAKLDANLYFAKAFGNGRGRSLFQWSARGQYSPERLPSLETLSLTGAYGVRGYGPGLFSADQGLISSFEWQFPQLLTGSKGKNWRIEPFLLADFAKGSRLQDELQNGDDQSNSTQAGDSQQFSAVGAGLRVKWRKHLSTQILIASPLEQDSSTQTQDQGQNDEIVLFELRWQ